jgi:pyruvate dehydrogenase E1 component beta subunit
MAVITMREAISQALWEEMERDPKVFILGEEVGVWGGTYAVTKGFLDHFARNACEIRPSQKRPLSAPVLALPWPACARWRN